MSRAAAPSRQPSSSRGGWLAHQERGSAAALRGSQADPTGFQPLRSSPSCSKRRLLAQAAWHRSAFGDIHAQLGREGPGALVRDVFSRGMAGVQAWPPGLDHRRPLFDENPR